MEKPNPKPITRAVFQWSHRWLGIVVGLYFIFLGLSGSWLVYKETFDAWTKPALRVASEPAPRPNLARVVESARTGVGAANWPARMVVPEGDRRNPIVSFNLSEPNGPRRFADAHVDAANAGYRGAENFRDTITGFLFITHHELFGGKIGHGLVAVGGMFCLLLLVSGLVVAWPKGGASREGWSRLFGFRKPRTAVQWHRELHRWAGVYGLVLMILVTATGTYLARPAWFGPEPTRSPRNRMSAAGDPTVLGAALESLVAGLEREGVPVRGAELRFDPAALTIEFESKRAARKFRYDVAAGTLAPIVEDAETRTATDEFLRANHALHVGRFWGALGSALVFLSGLLPLFFYITGFYFWLKTKGPA